MKRALFQMAVAVAMAAAAENKIWLEDVDRSTMTCGYKSVLVGRSVEGGLLSVGGKVYEHGLGTHAPSILAVPLGGKALAFEAVVGVDDEKPWTSKASVEFKVWVDGRLAATSGPLRRKKRTAQLKVDLTGAQIIVLEVTDGEDGNDSDHADWADAFFTFKDGEKPPEAGTLTEQLGVLTPKTGAAPRVNGPARVGVRPGSPILYRVPVTGERPMKISVAGLPAGAHYDADRASVNGAVARPGEYPLVVTAENAKGKATRTVTLVVGDVIALTPPMGWNSWNVFGGGVTEEKVKAAADAMIASGLADHGWCYINIDDFWQNRPGEQTDKTLMGAERNPDGTINPNARFPSMKGLADYIHAKGLRAGLYSSPGPLTCGGCTGSWMHEFQDAQTYAAWGYDYLKYDWCSYERVAIGGGLNRVRFPYLIMGKALREQNRDILFSLCQYGMGNVSLWGETTWGSCWRTTGDVFDNWGSIYGSIQQQAPLWPWSKPGAWNDPDMLCVGKMHWNGFKGSRLTPNEQYTHVSLWCLVGAPLMIGCDMTRLDEFTFNLLSNDEVLDVDQDALGRGAARIARDRMGEIWARPMADGSVAVGLLNAGFMTQDISFDLASAGLEGGWRVRDLWRQVDEGEARGVYTARVHGHATHLVRLWPARDGRLRKGMTDVRENAWRCEIEELRPVVPLPPQGAGADDGCVHCAERRGR
ncbi:MAG: NPCBM/NEW2 domain-containing protein [Kiritimatiellia bacterium]